jgi:glycosyltransferase involved in cell wall biosynthesis
VRILSISNVPHSPGQGSGYVITGYVNGLRERGHTVDAYGPADWLLADVHRARRYLYPLMIAIFGLRYCRPRQYDLIELWGGHAWLLAVCLRWIAADVPLIHHSNGIEQHRVQVQRQSATGPIQNRRWFQWDASRLHDWGLHAADAIVTVSSYDLPFLKERQYVPEDRLFAIENPLPDFFLDRDVQYDRPKRIGFCGGWSARKAPPVLTRDVTEVLCEHPEWTFSVVGVGDAEVAKAFPEDVRDRVEVISCLEREDLVDWYHSLAVLTLPSVYESFGLVMAEAMACGAALVATNVGFAHGLTHEKEALILPEAQSPHLAEVLDTLVENEMLRRRIAQNGHERVQDLRWKDAVDRLEDIYQTLIEEHSSSAITT